MGLEALKPSHVRGFGEIADLEEPGGAPVRLWLPGVSTVCGWEGDFQQSPAGAIGERCVAGSPMKDGAVLSSSPEDSAGLITRHIRARVLRTFLASQIPGDARASVGNQIGEAQQMAGDSDLSATKAGPRARNEVASFRGWHDATRWQRPDFPLWPPAPILSRFFNKDGHLADFSVEKC